MRIFIILVKGAPEEWPDNAVAFYGAEREVQDAHHLLVRIVCQRYVGRGEGVWVFGVQLEAFTYHLVSVLLTD